jgi:hypothetical protein
MTERTRSTGWREGGIDASGTSSRGARRATAFIAILAVAGGVAGLWFWIQTPAPIRFITVPVAEYTDSGWPTNPWAERDSDLLLAAFPGGEKAFAFQERERLSALLDALSGEPHRAVVLHITALGATKNGDVYILPGHAKPNDPATWLPLSKLLDGVDVAAIKHKLLILDIAQPLANFYRGPLADDVADRLHETLTNKSPNFPVLTSCGPGEVGQSLDDEQASVFGYYLSEGLRGGADGYRTDGQRGERDGRVTVSELAEFVRGRANRLCGQTPKLYGKSDDFPLTFETRQAPERPEALRYPAWLLEAWKDRDARRVAGAYRAAPAAAAAYDAALLRAERAWESSGREVAQRRFVVERDDLREPLDAARPKRALPIRSLVVAAAGKSVPPDLAIALEKLLAIKTATPPAKPEDVQKASDEFAAKAKPAPVEAAMAVWTMLARDPEPSPDRIRLLAATLAAVQPTPTTETFLIRRLAAWQPRAIPWPAQEIHDLLDVEDSLGHALALAPAAFPWISGLLADADKTRREGEAGLFDAKSLADVRAAAASLAEAQRGLRAVRRQWEIVQSARRAAEDSALALTSTAEDVVERTVDAGAWRGGGVAARALADLLARAPDGQSLLLLEWEGRLADWTRAKAGLEAPFDREAIRRRIAAGIDAAGLRSLLRGPTLPADDRSAVWIAARAASHKHYEKIFELDRADDEARSSLPVSTKSTEVADSERVALRTMISGELLRLAGIDGAPDPETWMVRLPKALDERIAKQDWQGASRLERVPVPGLLRGGEPSAARLLREEERQCRQWLSAYYTALGALRAAVPGASAFCESAAADVRLPARN